MMTIAQQWEERGKQLGKQLGLAEGEIKGTLKGEQQILRRLLTRKFGALPDEVVQRLNQADTEQLERWADQVLDAPNTTAPPNTTPKPTGLMRPVSAIPALRSPSQQSSNR